MGELSLWVGDKPGAGDGYGERLIGEDQKLGIDCAGWRGDLALVGRVECFDGGGLSDIGVLAPTAAEAQSGKGIGGADAVGLARLHGDVGALVAFESLKAVDAVPVVGEVGINPGEFEIGIADQVAGRIGGDKRDV